MESNTVINSYTVPNVPYPPTGGSMDAFIQQIFLWGNWAMVAIFLFIAFRSFRTNKTIIPFFCLIGGGISMANEPIVDIMGLCWFWPEGNMLFAEMMGRFIPAWMIPVYIWFVGGQCLLTLSWLQKGVEAKQVWKLYALFAAMNVVLEEIPLHFGLYTYYGAQPLQIGLLPLWWPVVNAAMPIVSATALYRLRPYLGKFWVVSPIVILPMSDAMTNAAVGWPVWMALNTTDNLMLTHLGAFITLALGLLLIHFVSNIAAGKRASAAWT